MSDTVKVKLNSKGIKNVLKSQMMMDAVMRAAQKEGEYDTSFVGFDRVHVRVKRDRDVD